MDALERKNERAAKVLAEYMADSDDGIEIDAPRMQLRQGQAIRSGRDKGNYTSNWCEDVEHERGLNRVLTEELVNYRTEVAWLLKALKWAAVEGSSEAEDALSKYDERAALSIDADGMED